MLKKTVTYTNFAGEEVTEDTYFNLSKADLIELEMSQPGGLSVNLKKIIEAEDGPAIIKEFKKIILMSYGKKSEDGKRFIKNKELTDEFLSSEAYSELFMELVTDADAASAFIAGIIPAGMEAHMDKMIAANATASPTIEPKVLTHEDLITIDKDELKNGLAEGRYVIKKDELP